MTSPAKRSVAIPHVVEALPSYYPSLDGLRAISVVFVIMWHTFGESRTSVPREFSDTLGAALIALSLAALVHRLLEEPARKFGKHRIRSPQATRPGRRR